MNPVAAPVTYALIGLTVLVSVAAWRAGPGLIGALALRVGEVTRRRGHHRLISSAFVHAGPAHLLLNMVSLWSFGPVVERLLGSDGLLVLYFGSAIAGGLMILANNRRNPDYAAIGASGAVSGVIIAFCLFFPMRKIYLLGLPFGLPAFAFALFYLALSAHLMRTPDRVISHEGHLGGALGGLALTLMMKPEIAFGRFG
jgi:membrane associated rhomboid family serine protease